MFSCFFGSRQRTLQYIGRKKRKGSARSAWRAPVEHRIGQIGADKNCTPLSCCWWMKENKANTQLSMPSLSACVCVFDHNVYCSIVYFAHDNTSHDTLHPEGEHSWPKNHGCRSSKQGHEGPSRPLTRAYSDPTSFLWPPSESH